MTNGFPESRRVGMNLERFQTSVSSCDPSALNDAASIGADMDAMSAEQLNRFRDIISQYQDNCACIRFPKPTRERIRTGIAGIQTAVAPTIQKIVESPTVEAARQRLTELSESPEAQNIRSKIQELGTTARARLSQQY